MEFVFICCLLLIGALNFILTLFLAVYVVRSMDRTASMIGELSQIMAQPFAAETPIAPDNQAKTWDQKYEEELEMIQRRLRSASGLADLSENASYNAPPAPNPQAAEGMMVLDR